MLFSEQLSNYLGVVLVHRQALLLRGALSLSLSLSFAYKFPYTSLVRIDSVMLNATSTSHGPVNTGMRRITTFRSTTDRIYDGGPVRL